jgi:hypothetical protein
MFFFALVFEKRNAPMPQGMPWGIDAAYAPGSALGLIRQV